MFTKLTAWEFMRLPSSRQDPSTAKDLALDRQRLTLLAASQWKSSIEIAIN